MLFSDLSSALKNVISPILVDVQADCPVAGLMMLDPSLTTYKDSLLYFGHTAQLSGGAFPKQLIVLGEDCAQRPIESPNCIVIRPEDAAPAFNCLQQQISSALQAETIYTRTLRMLLKGDDLTGILSEMAQQFGNPIVVMAVTGKILAKSEPFVLAEPLWAASVERGYCPVDFLEHIKSVRSKNRSPGTSEAFTRVCSDTGLTYVCSKIFVRDELVGYVFLFTHGEADRECYEILPMISKASGEIIQHYNVGSGLKTVLHRSVLNDLVMGVDPDHAKVRIAYSEMPFPKCMRMMVVKPSYYHGENFVKGRLHDDMQSIFGSEHSIVYGGGIVQVLPLDEQLQIPAPLLEALDALMESQHLIAGVSNEFYRPEAISQYYSQADETLRIAQRLLRPGRLHYYSDLAFYALLNQLPVELRIGSYCHPSLSRLRKYDTEHDTNLYETLKVYAESGFSQKQTAARLFLHRNTLIYRMQRVAEIGGIDLSDPQLAFLLTYSFQIDSYAQHRLS